MKTPQQIAQILGDVRKHLEERKASFGFELKVPPDGYLLDDDWMTVLVVPASGAVRASQYVEALGEVEDDLRAEGHHDVLLVPALVDD